MQRFFIILALLIFQSSLFAQEKFTHEDTLRGMLTPLRTCYDVFYYDLNLRINPEIKSINGFNKIHFIAKENFTKLQVDLFKNLNVDSVVYYGKKLKYTRDGNAVFIEFPDEQNKNCKEFFTVYYSGKPTEAVKPPWEGGIVWEKDSLERPWIGVACEGLGASVWWPNKDHLSDEPDSMRMYFEVPSGLTCVANGNNRSVKKLNDGYTGFEWFVSYPINNYNVTFNIANYTHFSETYNGKKGNLALDYYVLDYNLEKAKKHFRQVHPMLKCYENYFGPYPFYRDGFAMVETSYWGMEHQGAIAYGNEYKNSFGDLDYIILHETAHEWWGNSLSVPDHAEMWIHESFATYTENLLIECLYGYDASIKYLEFHKRNIDNKQPILGPLNVNYEGWDGSDMYYKGAWMLHTIRNIIGNDSLWFSIIKGLSTEFKISIVNTDQVINYFTQKSGIDLTPVFNQYLRYSNPPSFEYSLKKKGKNLILHCRWKADVKNFKMPFEVLDGKGNRVKIYPTSEFQDFTIENTTSKNFKVLTMFYYINAINLSKK